MRQRDGVGGGRFGERQKLLHLPGKINLTQEGNETGPPAEGRNGLGRFLQNQLGLAKERGDFSAGCLSINPYTSNPYRKATLFPISEIGLKELRGAGKLMPEGENVSALI